MTESVYSWMQNLAYYFILLSAVMNFLPDNSYKKYIQYYMGLLLILLILSPIFQTVGIQEKIDEYILEMEDMADERDVWEEKAKRWEEDWNQKITVVEGQEVIP